MKLVQNANRFLAAVNSAGLRPNAAQQRCAGPDRRPCEEAAKQILFILRLHLGKTLMKGAHISNHLHSLATHKDGKAAVRGGKERRHLHVEQVIIGGGVMT